MDLKKIKEAADRYAANHVGTQIMGKGSAEIEARKLALVVPDLLAEFERLKTLAREGWEQARNIARATSLSTIVANADAALKEIEATS